MLTKSQIDSIVVRSFRQLNGVFEDPIFRLVSEMAVFSNEKFGVSLGELLCPTTPLVYQDLSAAQNEPDFPEAKGTDVMWEKE